MVRISINLVNDSYQFINPVKQRELSLRNLQIPTIENLGVTRDQFDVIDLSDNNIRKLDNLPHMKRLETILLHNNRVQKIDKSVSEQLPNLKTLALTNNNIGEFGDIDPLAKCKKLEYLTLIGNPLTHKQHYRQYVIFKLKSVRVLDFRRIKLVERKAAKKLFKGSLGEKLRNEIVKESVPILDEQEQYEAAAAQVKARSANEQEKIKELIQSAKTLSEVENLQNVLQSGKVPGVDARINGSFNGGCGFEEEEDDDDVDDEPVADETEGMEVDNGAVEEDKEVMEEGNEGIEDEIKENEENVQTAV